MNGRVAIAGAGIVLIGALVACDDEGRAHRKSRGAFAHEEGMQETNDDHARSVESIVHITKAAVERSDIRLEEARETPVGGGVRVPAEVRPDPDREAHVASIVEGQITEVCGSVGDQVKAGDILAVVSSVTVGETRAAMSEAQAALSVAQSNFDRQQELVKEGIGAQRNLIEAEGALRTARARVAGLRDRTRVYGPGGSGARTLLRSTIDGQVDERHATVGEVVGPQKTLILIVDTSSDWVVGAVYPKDIEAVEPGVNVSFTSPDLPGKSWQGPLDWVSPMIDQNTRTLPVRFVLQNPEATLRPGLFGTLQVLRRDWSRVVSIADSGLGEINGARVVFVPTGEAGEFEIRPLTTGQHADGRVEILDGLATGDRYVAEGVFVLKSQLLRDEFREGHAH